MPKPFEGPIWWILRRLYFIQTFSVSAARTGNESMATMRLIQQVTEVFFTNLCVFVLTVLVLVDHNLWSGPALGLARAKELL